MLVEISNWEILHSGSGCPCLSGAKAFKPQALSGLGFRV